MDDRPPQLPPQAPPYDIVCGRDYNGQNVDCSDDIFFRNYLKDFINVFVKKVFNELAQIQRLRRLPNVDELLEFKKRIFKLCLDVTHYDMFDDFMKIRATRVEFGPTSHSIYDVYYVDDTLVQGPPVPFGIINGVQVPVVTIQGQQRDCRVVNLYTSGLIMYMLGQFGWIGNYPLGRIPSYTQYFPNSEDLADEYEGRALPDIKPLRGERPIPTPIDEIALLIINFFINGGRDAAKNFEVAGDGARDQRPVAPTLTYVANTSTNLPPVPDFSGRPSNGALIWNNPNQLRSTIIYLSVLQNDGHESSFLLGHDGTTRVIGLHISDIANPNNFQTWSVNSVTGVANQHFTFDVTLAATNNWNASNGSACNVTILKDGQRYPEPSDVFADKVRAATRGGAKKRNKSKRRNQKKSNKKNRHHNRKRLSRRKRFY
jgi:hypothetical protein